MTKNNIGLVLLAEKYVNDFNLLVKDYEKNNTVVHPNRYLSYKYYEEVEKLFFEIIR